MQLVDPLSMGHFRLIPEALLRAIRKSFIHHSLHDRPLQFWEAELLFGRKGCEGGSQGVIPNGGLLQGPWGEWTDPGS